jgi:hypothetical protein
MILKEQTFRPGFIYGSLPKLVGYDHLEMSCRRGPILSISNKVYVIFVDELNGVYKICVYDSTSFFVEIEFLQSFQGQARREGPVSNK